MTTGGEGGGGAGGPDIEALRRQSGVALRADGTFTYRGRPIENERVIELFHRGIDVRPDGQVTLTVGRFMAYPEVEGVARFVARLGWDTATAGPARAWLAGGREVALAGATIGYAPDDRFYLWIAGLRGPARALRDAHQALAGWLAASPEEASRALSLLAAIPRADAPAPIGPTGPLEPGA